MDPGVRRDDGCWRAESPSPSGEGLGWGASAGGPRSVAPANNRRYPTSPTIAAAISRGGRSAPASTVGSVAQRPSSPAFAIAA